MVFARAQWREEHTALVASAERELQGNSRKFPSDSSILGNTKSYTFPLLPSLSRMRSSPIHCLTTLLTTIKWLPNVYRLEMETSDFNTNWALTASPSCLRTLIFSPSHHGEGLPVSVITSRSQPTHPSLTRACSLANTHTHFVNS